MGFEAAFGHIFFAAMPSSASSSLAKAGGRAKALALEVDADLGVGDSTARLLVPGAGVGGACP